MIKCAHIFKIGELVYTKITSILLIVITLLLVCIPATANDEGMILLSELSDDELLAFPDDYDVIIPPIMSRKKLWVLCGTSSTILRNMVR